MLQLRQRTNSRKLAQYYADIASIATPRVLKAPPQRRLQLSQLAIRRTVVPHGPCDMVFYTSTWPPGEPGCRVKVRVVLPDRDRSCRLMTSSRRDCQDIYGLWDIDTRGPEDRLNWTRKMFSSCVHSSVIRAYTASS